MLDFMQYVYGVVGRVGGELAACCEGYLGMVCVIGIVGVSRAGMVENDAGMVENVQCMDDFVCDGRGAEAGLVGQQAGAWGAEGWMRKGARS